VAGVVISRAQSAGFNIRDGKSDSVQVLYVMLGISLGCVKEMMSRV
jgi:hypothetical protein